jgi:hypothetical protein
MVRIPTIANNLFEMDLDISKTTLKDIYSLLITEGRIEVGSKVYNVIKDIEFNDIMNDKRSLQCIAYELVINYTYYIIINRAS